MRDGVLDGSNDDVTYAADPLLPGAEHPDALDAASAGVVGDIEVRFLLDHRSSLPASGARLLDQPGHAEALPAAYRTCGGDLHDVSDLVGVLLVMREVPLATP